MLSILSAGLRRLRQLRQYVRLTHWMPAEPEPDAALMSRRDLVYVYYPGDFSGSLADSHRYEEEFQRGLAGNSAYFHLVAQPILDEETGSLAYKEILYRGGKERDTAPYQRMIKMTPAENGTLLETTLRQYKEEERCTVNITETSHLRLCRTNKRIVAEITQRIIEHTTQEIVQQAKDENPLLDVWADDVPFNSNAAMWNIFRLLPCLDGIKIGTADLAKAYEEPIVKNPIDAPGKSYTPPHDPVLKAKIDQFLIMLSVLYPKMLITLELSIPREKLPSETKDMKILTQGREHGARAFRIAPYDPTSMVQTTSSPSLETYTISAAQPTSA